MNMDKILEASLGEVSSEIKATFRKTINNKPYETEVIEAQTVLDMGDRELTGAERLLITGILHAQLEYETYCNLCYKGIITTQELEERRIALEKSVGAFKAKAENILGKSMDSYFEHKELGVENKE